MTGLPQVGKTYVVTHTRKGTFTMEVTAVHDGRGSAAVVGTIIAGSAKEASFGSADYAPGDEIRVDSSLATFKEVT